MGGRCCVLSHRRWTEWEAAAPCEKAGPAKKAGEESVPTLCWAILSVKGENCCFKQFSICALSGDWNSLLWPGVGGGHNNDTQRSQAWTSPLNVGTLG